MQFHNHYCNRAKNLKAKFRHVLSPFTLALTASNTARLTGLEVRAINALYLRLRCRLHPWTRCRSTWMGPWNSTRVTSARNRVRGKRGWRASGKTIVFGLFRRGCQVCTEIVPDYAKKTL